MRLFLLLLLTVSLAQAQTVSKQLIGSAGESLQAGNINLSFAIGETTVGSLTPVDGSMQLSNGFFLSLDLGTLSLENNVISSEIIAYPNPTDAGIQLTGIPENTKYEVAIMSLDGSVILNKQIMNNEHIDISQLAPSIYLLTTRSLTDSVTQTIKIIKK